MAGSRAEELAVRPNNGMQRAALRAAADAEDVEQRNQDDQQVTRSINRTFHLQLH